MKSATDKVLETKCTTDDPYGEPFLIEETNTIEVPVDTLKEVKIIEIKFNKSVSQIAELIIN